MARDDSQSSPADKMLFTKPGEPWPRLLPDGRVISDPDSIREVADLTDEQAMLWLDTETDA